LIPLPIATGFYTSEILPLAAQTCKNWVPIVTEGGSLNQRALLDRSGIVKFATLTGEHRGAIDHVGVYITLNGTVLSTIDSAGTVSTIGTILGTGRVSIAKNDDFVVFVTNLGTGYVYNVGAGTVAIITDGDFTLSSTVSFVDGYFVFTSANGEQFFISALNDPTSFNALDYSTAEERPDPIVASFVYKNILHILGTETIEKYRNIGGVNFPFIRINQASNSTGCYSLHSPIEVGESFAFIGGGHNEGAQILMYSGNAPQKISTSAIDNAIQDFTDAELTAAFSMVWQERGQHLMLFTFPSNRITSQTWGYNLSSGEWFEFISDGAAYRAKSTVKIYDKFIVGDDGSQCGFLDKDIHTDYGDTILREKASQPFILEEGEEYIVKAIEPWFESGVGLTNGQGSEPQVFMDFSTDLGRTWQPEDWACLGKIGEYDVRTEFRRQGLVRRDRVYRFKASDPAPFNLMKLTATL